MSLNIFWFLPTHGDGKYLGTAEGVEGTMAFVQKRKPKWAQ